MTDTGLPTDLPEENDDTEGSGILAEALGGVAALLTSEADDTATPETETDEAETPEPVEEVAVETAAEPVVETAIEEPDFGEIDEDNPFAAAAAIFSPPVEEETVEEVTEASAEDATEDEAADDESADDDADSGEAAAEAEAEVVPEPEAEVATEAEAATTTKTEAAPEAEAEPEAASEVAEDEASDDGDEAEAEEVLPPASPYDLPGGWYVVHSYSGYENKVKANLSSRIKSMHMEDSIFDIVIPMEEVVEIKSGRKVTVDRKQFPGYILVRMYLDDDSWGVVRNTPGVTGFVGSGIRPTPLSRREVERILGVRKDEEKKTPRFKPDWEVGETVRVLDGPFADFNGIIEDINVDQSKVRVLVDIFGRETPVELNFEQIQKF
jgi:transcriptional antiterminator NusG